LTIRRVKGSIVIWPETSHNYPVAYRTVFTANAIDDFNALDARWRATVRDAIRLHLTHEPTKQSKSRIKRLRDVRHPQFRLRVGEIRVFYDVTNADVVIIAIMSKEKTIQWLEEHGEK
jgi:mRNA-degrading endonuclease RelE of RelBE toxin-antitoxin system